MNFEKESTVSSTGNPAGEFRFVTKLDQTILLGRKAKNIVELLEGIKVVPGSSMYYHTHRFLQQHQYLSPEPPNDFAYWIINVLNEDRLGEMISSVDTVRFKTIADLRKAFIEIISSYLQSSSRIVDAPAGEEFHFMSLQTFVLPTSHSARTVKEFKEQLQAISIHSLYYHIFDAHLRLEQDENDFSAWFREMGKTELADSLLHLDPYTSTLETLRTKIITLVSKYDKD